MGLLLSTCCHIKPNWNLFEIQNPEDLFLEAECVLVDDLLDVSLRGLDGLEKSDQLLLVGLVKLNNLHLLVVLTPGEPDFERECRLVDEMKIQCR